MDILAIIRGVISFVNWLTSTLDRERFVKLGRDELIAEQITKLNNKYAAAVKIADEVDKMSEEDIDKELGS